MTDPDTLRQKYANRQRLRAVLAHRRNAGLRARHAHKRQHNRRRDVEELAGQVAALREQLAAVEELCRRTDTLAARITALTETEGGDEG